jgi:hypothetical protein
MRPEMGGGALDLSWVAEDPRLKERALAALGAMGPAYLQDLIVSHMRFDRSHTFHEPDGSVWKAPHYPLELLLGVMPEYMSNAHEAGLLPDQAYNLVRTILTAEGRSEWAMNDEPVVQLSRAFKNRAERNERFSAEDYAILHGLIVDTARSGDNSVATLDAYRALTRLGFTSAESNTLIRDELYADSLFINFAVGTFNALSIAEVNPGLLTEVCRLIHGEDPQLYDIQAGYASLKDLIITICPARDLPPNDLLAIVKDGLEKGRTIVEVGESIIASGKRVIEGGAGVHHPAERRERHFIRKPGPLELSPLPYRSERSFSDGAADIGRIALHKPRHREPIGEGMWVFDPEAPTPIWYSLGGETDVDVERQVVRAHYPRYPLGDLSRSPVLYHAHPVALERPGLNRGLYPNIALPAVARFLAATPSRRDYAMVAELMRSPEYKGGAVRSFIAHGSGTMEYTFPNDPEVVEEMSRVSQALRDDVLADVDWERVLFARKWRGLAEGEQKNTADVVGELVNRFNHALPKGFQLKLFSPEVQVEL